MLYFDYLQSDHWQTLRGIKLKSVSKQCESCHSDEPLHVHHIRYRNLLDCKLPDLLVLCERCHDSLHRELKRRGARPEWYTAQQSISLIQFGRPNPVPPKETKAERVKRLKAKRRAAEIPHVFPWTMQRRSRQNLTIDAIKRQIETKAR